MKIVLHIDDDWQAVVNSSSSQCIHSVIGLLRVHSLVVAYDIIILVGTSKFQSSTLNQIIMVAFNVFQFWKVTHGITGVCVKLQADFYFGDVARCG